MFSLKFVEILILINLFQIFQSEVFFQNQASFPFPYFVHRQLEKFIESFPAVCRPAMLRFPNLTVLLSHNLILTKYSRLFSKKEHTFS